MNADIHIYGGRVIDPARNKDGIEDVIIAGGRIIAAREGEPVAATQRIDAGGCIVTPGLIDMHNHMYAGADNGVPADAAFLPAGVTTGVDGGSTGANRIKLFMALALAQKVRCKAFLHICPEGLGTAKAKEELDPRAWDRALMRDLFKAYPGILVGLKVRYSKDIVKDHGDAPLRVILEIAEELGVPVCVHVSDPALPNADLLALLRPGDIFCHVFHGKGETVCPNGSLNPAVKAAQQRGVIFDACNGRNHFAFDSAVPALQAGFFPDVISTDLGMKTLWQHPVIALPFLMSKYIALGCELNAIVRAVTATPARVIGMAGRIGTLAPGALADVAVFKLVSKPVTFADSLQKTVQGDAVLVPQMTVLDGKIMFRQTDFVA